MKTALLLWDNVGFIVPDADFSPYGDTAETQEALEIIGRTYVPTEKDKKDAHRELEGICNDRLPETLYFELEKPERGVRFLSAKVTTRNLGNACRIKARSDRERSGVCAEGIHGAAIRLLHDVDSRSVLFAWRQTSSDRRNRSLPGAC